MKCQETGSKHKNLQVQQPQTIIHIWELLSTWNREGLTSIMVDAFQCGNSLWSNVHRIQIVCNTNTCLPPLYAIPRNHDTIVSAKVWRRHSQWITHFLADQLDGTPDKFVASHTSRYHLYIIKLQSSNVTYKLKF
jgi:hypothetical protein